MTIAELFVNLSVKGEGNAAKALTNVQKGLGDIASSGLAAKAAIVGVIYGLEKMMSYSAQQGMALQQFGNLTGISTEQLQRWQYAARQSGVSADEMAGSIKSVQSAMSDMLIGKGAPAGMGVFAQAVGFDPAKARDTLYVMEKLKEFAKIAPPDIGNAVLRSFGINDNTVQFLRSTRVELDKIKPGNIFSGGEIAQLAKVNIAWENFFQTLKLFSGHLTAQFGLDAVKNLSNAFRFLIETSNDLSKLTKQFPEFKNVAVAAGVAIAAAFAPVTAAITGIIWVMSQIEKYKQGKESIFGENGKLPGFLNFGKDIMDTITGVGHVAEPSIKGGAIAAAPGSGPVMPNVTVHNHGVTHPKETGNETQKGINRAFRSMQSQKQVN